MSAHVDLDGDADPEAGRREVHRLLHQEYDIEHTTIQTEAWVEPRLLSIEHPEDDLGEGDSPHPTGPSQS